MKVIFIGFAAMIAIAVGAWVALDEIGFSSAERQSGANVRLE